MNEAQAEKCRLAAERLKTAETVLIAARKNYNKALRAWDQAAQVKFIIEDKR